MFKIQFVIKFVYNNLIILSHQLENVKKGRHKGNFHIKVCFEV